jgi:selenocysteine lyase/cysteine desulfurase
MARARWKIENETFNTLKNQGYHFEHNFGHGRKHLATGLAIIMLLAFSIDQIQQHASRTFRLIWKGLKTRKKLWSAMRASFSMQNSQSMSQLWQKIAWEYEIELDSS